MEWRNAIQHAKDVRLLFQACCERVEIAGSLRRQCAEVHDIEIVAKPKTDPFDQLQIRVADMLSHHWLEPGPKSKDGKKPPMGPRYYRLQIPVQRPECDSIQLDLFAVLPPADFGVIYAIRTGSAEFSHWLVTEALRKGMQVEDGQLWKWSPSGKPLLLQERVKIPCPEEVDFFRALGIEYVHPSDRQQPAIMSTGPTTTTTTTTTTTGFDGNNKVTSYQGVTNKSPHTRDGLRHFPVDPEGGRP